MTERKSTSFKKENGNVTVAADDLVQLLNTWTFDSSRDEEDLVVPDKDSSAAHLYLYEDFLDLALKKTNKCVIANN